MKLDSIALSSVTSEIKESLMPAKIIELYQLSKYEILLILKRNNYTGKLFCSVRPDRMAFFLSESSLPSKNFSSLFFNQLQNWVQGGTLLDIEHYQFDRIIKLVIQPFTKFGSLKQYQLIIEFMGKHSNIILIDEQNNIKAPLKQVGSEVNRYREVKPEIPYVFPPKQEKYNPLTINKDDFFIILNRTRKNGDIEYLWQFFLNHFNGIGIKSSKEIVMYMNFPLEQKIDRIPNQKLPVLWEKFSELIGKIKKNEFSPVVLIDKKTDQLIDYSLLCPENSQKTMRISFDRTSSCLEFFFNRLKEKERKLDLYYTISKVLRKNIDKLVEKKCLLQNRKKEIEKSDEYKKKGELIKANLWNIKPGTQEIIVVDYSNPDQNKITLDLNPDLTPLQNAKNFFKKYKKLQQNSNIVKNQINENIKTLQQLKELEVKLAKNSNSVEELSAIYNKLVNLKYIKKQKVSSNTRKTEQIPSINKYLSPDGWTILVGKNNKQNEYILRHCTSGNDFWLHNLTKPGSHVIIKNHKNMESPPHFTLLFAARLAGYYSKSKDKETAIIIHTQRKYVRKPKNAKPGKVIYSNEKTLPVSIDHDEIKRDINRMLIT